MATTVIADIVETLAADATLVATVTGAIISTAPADTDKSPLNPTDASSAYTADATSGVKKLKPSIVVTPMTEIPLGARGIGRHGIVRIDFYEAEGYEAIETAHLRVYALLHDQRLTLTSGNPYYCQFVDYRGGLVDPSVITGTKRPASNGYAYYQYDLAW